MSNKNRAGKWLVALVALCLVPAAFADRGRGHDRDNGCDPRRDRHCQEQVPEGGSSAIYLLGAGLTCFGAIFLRSKMAKPTQA